MFGTPCQIPFRDVQSPCVPILPESSRRSHARLLKVASAHLKRGQHEEAIATCDEILSTDPTHLGALEICSRSLWAKQDFAKLEVITRQLIALNPFEPGYFGLRGMALRALGRYGEAVHALRRDPGSITQLSDLEAFQASLVKDLIDQDAVFAAQYAKSPESATKLRGLECEMTVSPSTAGPANRNKVRSIRQYS